MYGLPVAKLSNEKHTPLACLENPQCLGSRKSDSALPRPSTPLAFPNSKRFSRRFLPAVFACILTGVGRTFHRVGTAVDEASPPQLLSRQMVKRWWDGATGGWHMGFARHSLPDRSN
jgi:hypothetical protein